VFLPHQQGCWHPKPGDLIEIFRFGYQHWVVYVGNGYVVHLTTPSKNPTGGSSSPFSVQGGKAMVKREQLEDVARGCSYQINNYLDDMYQPLSAEKIISYAEKLIGKEIWYNVLGWNCEHFVTHLRYGKSHSEQVRPCVGDLSLLEGAGAWVGLSGLCSQRGESP
uniref:LRAT domain-containing protein n=1 Tax=Spermophilus dauricus TaxID=99837 RepID=A0A8C9PMR2_SPEDA